MGDKFAPSKGNSGSEKTRENACNNPYVENMSVTGAISESFILKFGEYRVYIISMVFLIAGAIILIYGLIKEGSQVFLLGSLFLILGCWFFILREYYLSRKCKRCGKEFAYVKTRDTEIVTEVHSVDSYDYFKCKYCGHECVEKKDVTPGLQ